MADKSSMSSRILGIDLGTVNSCVAVVEGGHAVVLSDEARSTIPSCLALRRDKEIVGEAARRQAVTEPLCTVSAVKRILGHSFESPEVQAVLTHAPYPIRPSPVGGVLLQIGRRELTPVQISARILERIREVAESALNEPVRRAVISVPAHFTDVQRKATKLAAEYAGLEVVRLLNEPTAAAFAYGYQKGEDFRLAVYDLGGGTFDITVMCAEGDCFRVQATHGDSFLGGEDFDNALVEALIGAFQGQYGHDLGGNRSAELRLKEAAERAKVELSQVTEALIELPFLAQLEDGSRPLFSYTLTREKLEEIAGALVDRTLALCRRCLQESNVERIDIDEVLLVGGQSRMPLVREKVREFFGREPRRDINPDEVVALGAALYGYSLAASGLTVEEESAAGEAYAVARKDTEVARKVLHTVRELREETLGDEELAQRLEVLLAQTEADGVLDDSTVLETDDVSLGDAVEDLRGELVELNHETEELLQELYREVEQDPDPGEVGAGAAERAVQQVAERLGAAEQASQEAKAHWQSAREYAGARKVSLVDVTSHGLGIATAGELFSVLIDKNTPTPTTQRRTFTTNQDGQSEVEIRVYQGGAERVDQNQLLGAFVLNGIAPAPRMEPRIDVEFSVDENGILSVRAQDSRSGLEQSIRVEDALNLHAVQDQER